MTATLTKTEERIFTALLDGAVWTNERLVRDALGKKSASSGLVPVTVFRLRRKIAADGYRIESRRFHPGYRLVRAA